MRASANGVNIIETIMGNQLELIGLAHLKQLNQSTSEISISYLEEETGLGKRPPHKPEL